MPLGLTEHLPSLVARRFSAAKQSNALVFSETQVTTIRSANIPVSWPVCLRISYYYVLLPVV